MHSDGACLCSRPILTNSADISLLISATNWNTINIARRYPRIFLGVFFQYRSRQLKANTSSSICNMIVSPREAFVVSSENSVSDDDTGSNHSSPSTTGAAVDNKQNREFLIISFNTNFYDSMGHYARPLINNKATKTLFKTRTSDPVAALWVDSWNTTVSQLSPVSQKMFKASRHWPDRGFGGPRAVKQLFEVLVLKTYIPKICNIKLEEFRTLYEEIKRKLSELYLKSTIDSHEEETQCVQQLKDLKMQYKELQEHVDLKTSRIIDDFKRITIDGNTIKKKEHQDLLQSFIDDPTIQSYENALQLFIPKWKSYLDEQTAEFESVKSGYEKSGVMPPEVHQSKRQKTSDIRNTSDSEKAAIKRQCDHRCRGLPEGLLVTCNNPGVLQDWELEVDHSIPLKLLCSDEDYGNKKCLCGRCHNFKTKFIDPLLTKNSENAELLSMYKVHNSLPDWATNEINLSLRVTTQEDIIVQSIPEQVHTTSHEVADGHSTTL